MEKNSKIGRDLHIRIARFPNAVMRKLQLLNWKRQLSIPRLKKFIEFRYMRDLLQSRIASRPQKSCRFRSASRDFHRIGRCDVRLANP